MIYMSIKIIRKFLALIIILNFTICTFSQKSNIYADFDKDFKLALELLNKQKYASAQVLFNKIANEYEDAYSDVKTDAEYYSAICALELFNEDAEYLITSFITSHPESPRIRMANFQMGRFHYRKKNYTEALSWFNRVDKYDLNNDELAEYYFKIGYSNFVQNEIQKATKAFYEIKDSGSKYSAPAMYYYSHIAYNKANYETALNGFKSLSENEIFTSVVPYYISQIYYLQEKYDKLLAYAPNYIDSASVKRAPEIARIIGEAYYRTDNYEDALPYLEKYKDKSGSYSREDIYQLAFAYYKSGKYTEATKYFPSITNVDDRLSQNAYYHLADCYLQKDDKKNAHLAFFSASKLDFNKEIKEVSMLNYAKLTYELAYSPFNETIKTFEQFITEFPNSSRVDEAYNYLVDVYLTSKNYRDALISIERIKNKSPEITRAYQRVTHFRGLELYDNLQYEKAVKIFNKSLSVESYDKSIAAQTLYWKAESFYRLQKYNQANETYKKFLVTPGAIILPEFNLAYYNIGYAYFKKKDYKNSLSWFRKFVDNEDQDKVSLLSDANIRIGDIYFIDRDYKSAASFYNNAVELKSTDYDYALFQKAFSNGLLKNYTKKIDDLKILIQDTNSTFYDDALFELGKAYVVIDSLPLAINNYEEVLINFPNSSYLKKSVLQLGLLYYNLNKNQEALAMYKRVISDYPGSQESKDALLGIKNIYVDINKVDDYFAYVKQLGDFADVRQSEQDSLTYLSAENMYINGNFNQSIIQFNNYIQKFSSGSFIIDAYYYLADSYLRLDETDLAINALNNIKQKPKNQFTEPTLLLSSSLHFDQQEYVEAIEDYALLESISETKTNLIAARLGLLRSTYIIKAYDQTIKVAYKIFHTEKVSAEIIRETRYKLAKSYVNTNDLENALKEYRILAQNVSIKEGAEAKFRVAEILYETNRLLLAEEVIFSFENTPYQFWLAKSFILLSDIYKTNDDLFQAKATLESILQNYENNDDDIIEIANKKLKEINALEDERMPGKTTEDMEIEFNKDTDKNIKELFEEEVPQDKLEFEEVRDTVIHKNEIDTLSIKKEIIDDNFLKDSINVKFETEEVDTIKN